MSEVNEPIPTVGPAPSSAAGQEPLDQWAVHRENCAELILSTTNFIVYLTKDTNEVHWDAQDDYLERKGINTSDCQSRITYLESFPRKHLSKENQNSFECQLGEAMVQALKGNPKKCNFLLNQASRFLAQKNQEFARRTYVVTSFILAAAVVLLTMLLLRLKNWGIIQGISAWGWDYESIISVGIGGALGTLLFTFVRASATSFAPDAEVKSHLIEAGSRLSVGLIVAVVAICAMKAGLILEPLAHNGYASFLVCVIAGYSERFGTSIVEYLDHIFSKEVKVKESARGKGRRRGKGKTVLGTANAAKTKSRDNVNE